MHSPQFLWQIWGVADHVFFLQLNEMLRNPGEGHFWQVDHIKPVYEGGGQCSLDNLQTLCTVCHREVSDTFPGGCTQWARLAEPHPGAERTLLLSSF